MNEFPTKTERAAETNGKKNLPPKSNFSPPQNQRITYPVPSYQVRQSLVSRLLRELWRSGRRVGVLRLVKRALQSDKLAERIEVACAVSVLGFVLMFILFASVGLWWMAAALVLSSGMVLSVGAAARRARRED
jgi:hypothetical protein